MDDGMAAEGTNGPPVDRSAQVRVHLTTRSDAIQLPEMGPLLVSTGMDFDVRRKTLR